MTQEEAALIEEALKQLIHRVNEVGKYVGVEEDGKELANRIVDFKNRLEKDRADFDQALDEHFTKVMERYDVASKKIRDLRTRMDEDLAFMRNQEFQLPYGTKDLIEIVERFKYLDDNAFARLRDLAVALNRNTNRDYTWKELFHTMKRKLFKG